MKIITPRFSFTPMLSEACERAIEQAVLKDSALQDAHTFDDVCALVLKQAGTMHTALLDGNSCQFEFTGERQSVLRIAERIKRQK